jgi:Ca2+-transporting ATPase
MNWHKLTIHEVFDLLGTSQFGITSVSAEERWIEYGRNELDETKAKSIWMVFLEQFKDVLIVILLVAAFISYFVGDIIDTIVILIIVLLTTSLGLFQQYRAENAIRLLKKMSVPRSKVLRNGVQIFLPSTDLVVGDIVFLEVGNAVPADIRLIESTNLIVDESALSGESNPVFKITQPINLDTLSLGDKINMAFKGTFITYGRGVGIIIAVGMQTELGRIAKLLQENELLTPLQQRMVVFGKKITLLVLFLCFVFFFVGWYLGEDLSTLILTSISLAVAAIPEALPSVITISLALAARKMIRFNCLIRRLPAVETLGSVKFICTDKTGTLTKNSMQVEEVFMNGQLVKKNNFLSIPQQFPDHLLLPAIFLNNDIIEVTTIEI